MPFYNICNRLPINANALKLIAIKQKLIFQTNYQLSSIDFKKDIYILLLKIFYFSLELYFDLNFSNLGRTTI